ncbi:MAG TPA: calcium-binding protein [Beijerinckiaceae bacterium]|jgi:Ca2+-binding RTX toxin-like protein
MPATPGNDTDNFNISTDPAANTNYGTGDDVLNVSAAAAGQVRVSFTSAEVGNGNPNDAGTLANQDGGLAVRLQLENASDGLTGAVSRFDDEGITFVSGTAGLTFDVRDLVSGVQRGNLFEVVTLGTSGTDTQTAVQASRPYYFNAGLGNDVVTGGTANDFLVGGGGNDTLSGGDGNDSFIGGGGNDAIVGGAGNDTAIVNVSTDGSDATDLGAGADIVSVSAASAGQIRLSFTSAEVGNGNALDAGTLANQDGGLAVRFQAEDGTGALTGGVSRFDDEGITFVAAAGTTFDVRDLVSGVQRGDAFEIVALGTQGADNLSAVQASRSYYFNAGQGNDVVTGGTANDFLVGGAGNDTLSGGDGNDAFIGGGGNDAISGGTGTDRVIFSFALNTATIGATSNGATTITGAEGTDTFRGIEQFQFSDRTVEVNDGSPLVDDLFYLIRNPDVAAAGVDPDAHYAQFGAREGRDPNAFFSTDGYLAANPDVARAGVNPLEHYTRIGWREGRDPGANFDNELYLRTNPDVAAAGINPLEHFLAFGQAEGRTVSPTIGRSPDLAPAGFDAEFYLLANGDVADAARAAGDAGYAFAARHYQEFGFREGRNPNAIFDTKGYLTAYQDVAAAGVNPLAHYNQFGFREGRDPSAAFDTTAYLAANQDVAAAGVNPLTHYLQFGIYEGRSAIADGTFGIGLIG